MHTLRVRPFMYFAMGIAVTVAAAWSMSAWQASAAVSADESTFVNVSPTRILDTRDGEDIGLNGPFNSLQPQDLKVTGSIPTKLGTAVVVPDGATGVILNVTAVNPTADGFVAIRPADAPGVPTTSSLNFKAGDVIPNSVTVQVPTAGADAGKIEITYDSGNTGPTTEILVDVVGYTKNSGLASLQAQVNDLQAQVANLTAAGASVVFDGDAAGGSLTGTYPNPTLGANSVGAAQLVNGTVGLAEMSAKILATSIDFSGNIPAGGCTSDIPTSAPGAVAGSFTLVFVSKPTVAAGDNVFIAQGGSVSASPETANIVICNNGGLPADPPALDVSFITLGP